MLKIYVNILMYNIAFKPKFYPVNIHSFIKSWFYGMQQFSLNPATLKSFQLQSNITIKK